MIKVFKELTAKRVTTTTAKIKIRVMTIGNKNPKNTNILNSLPFSKEHLISLERWLLPYQHR